MEVDDSDITESIQNDKIIVDDSEQMQSEFQEEENVDSKDIDDEYIDETSTVGDEVGENPETVILENRDEKDYLEFIEKLFPKKRQNWILDDLDLISPEESYTRLTWLGIILTNILCIVTFVQIIYAFVIFWPEKTPLAVQPILPEDNFLRKFPIPHLVTISERGEIHDFSLEENVSPSQGYLFTLQMSPKNPENIPRHYYAFSDARGFLYFVDSELRHDIIQYHQKQGHRVMPNSAIEKPPDHCYNCKVIYIQCLLIDGFFWLFSQTDFRVESIQMYPFSGKTFLDTKMWSMKKRKTVDGPKLNYRFKSDGYVIPGCAATLNRSHFAMIAFHNKNDFISLLNQRFQLVNFQTQKITDYPNLPYPDLPIQNENNFEFKFCSASILHKKNNDISLVTHLQYENYLGSFAGSLSYKKFSFLVSYDLNQGIDGQWKIRGTWKVDDYPRLINFWQVRGSFYSLFSDGNFIHHQNLYDWKTLANFSHNFTRFVGNGAIYYA